MQDVIFLGTTILFFVISFAYLYFCERVRNIHTIGSVSFSASIHLASALPKRCVPWRPSRRRAWWI